MRPKTSQTKLNYPDMGRTRSVAALPIGAGQWPAGYRGLDQQIFLGNGRQIFDAVAQGVMTWQIQRRAGLRVSAAPRAAVGVRVVSGMGVGDVRVPSPCEVVWAQEPSSMLMADGSEVELAGFGYGTLPGHPVIGEEAFIVYMAADSSVFFRVLAFSKPANLFFAMSSPVTRLVQNNITKGYLQGAKSLARL